MLLPYSSPFFWALNNLFLLIVTIIAMLFGNKKGRSERRKSVYREVGVEIVFVLFPFLIYSVVHALNGSFEQVLMSSELPMAAMIISGIAIFSLVKGAFASGGKYPLTAFLISTLCSLTLFMSYTGLVFYLILVDAEK